MIVSPIRRLAAIAILTGSLAARGTEPDIVPATIRLRDATDPQEFACRNDTLDFETTAGRLRFKLAEIQSVTAMPGADTYHVQAVDGSIWVARLTSRRLAYRFLDAWREIPLRDGQVAALVTTPSARRLAYAPSRAKVLLEDGSQVLLRTEGFDIEVENACGRWTLPVGALSAVKFLFMETDDKTRAVAIVRFMNGYVERMLMRSSDAIEASDVLGNTVRLDLAHIKGILGTAVTSDMGEPPGSGFLGQAVVLATDGTRQDIALPTVAWDVRTAWGRFRLPSQSVADITPSATDDAWSVRTIFGETFSGRLTPATIPVPIKGNDGDDGARLALGAYARIRFAETTHPLPAGWLVWHLVSGEVFCAKFANEDDVVPVTAERQMHPENIFSLSWANKEHLVVVSHSRATRLCTPKSRKVKAVLLSNGMPVEIPWSDIQGIYTKPRIDSAVPEVPAIASAMEDCITPPAAAPETLEPIPMQIRLRTAVGTVEIDVGRIESVLHDVSNERSVVRTVGGDTLSVTAVDESDINAVAGTAVILPDSGMVKVLNPARTVMDPLPPVSCRLRSGGVICGYFVTPSIAVYATVGSRERIDVPFSEISAIHRNDDGDLEVALTDGRSLGAPRDRSMEFGIAAIGTTNRIVFSTIDALTVGPPLRLPPPTWSGPDMLPAAPGMTCVRGGTFNQGRSRGEGAEDETPPHTVVLPGYLIDTTEVSRNQFAAFVADTRYRTVAELSGSVVTWRTPGFLQRYDHPAVCVTWFDAVQYCNWRSARAGLNTCYDIKRDGTVITDRAANGFRLPTEAEWEYAARAGGRDIAYPWGAEDGYRNADDGGTRIFLANCAARPGAPTDPWEWTNPVAEFAPNELGLFGMGGNVWEWCEDWYFDRAYAQRANQTVHSPCLDTNDAGFYTSRVMRGGSFMNDIDLLRCTSRGSGIPSAFNARVGFRCVRNATSTVVVGRK